MPAFTPAAQGLIVVSLPALLAMTPSVGTVRTVALHPVPMAAIVNVVRATGGGIVAARSDGGLILSGRRDRLLRALLPLGILALPSTLTGCTAGREG